MRVMIPPYCGFPDGAVVAGAVVTGTVVFAGVVVTAGGLLVVVVVDDPDPHEARTRIAVDSATPIHIAFFTILYPPF